MWPASACPDGCSGPESVVMVIGADRYGNG